MIPRYNEKTAAKIGFSCYDEDHVLQVPTTINYQIDCLTTGAAIRADTAITPAVSSGTIDLTPTDTTLQSQDNATELRLLTLTTDVGLDSQYIETFKFEVLNLKSVT